MDEQFDFKRRRLEGDNDMAPQLRALAEVAAEDRLGECLCFVQLE